MIVTLITLLAVLIIFGPWLLAIAHRLDRLHARTDAAWAALDKALARRAEIACLIADTLTLPNLRHAAEQTKAAPPLIRETRENELSQQLAGLDYAALPLELAQNLIEAEQRLILARRVHSDAVRDTLSQRKRRSVRWLRLSETSARPTYFEIAEPLPR